MLQTYFNGKFFWTFSQLIRNQEGLSKNLLGVEKSTCEAVHVFIPSPLGFQLNVRLNFDQNSIFSVSDSVRLQILIRLHKSIKIHHFLIIFHHSWNWCTITTWKIHFQSKLSYSQILIKSTGTNYKWNWFYIEFHPIQEN